MSYDKKRKFLTWRAYYFSLTWAVNKYRVVRKPIGGLSGNIWERAYGVYGIDQTQYIILDQNITL